MFKMTSSAISRSELCEELSFNKAGALVSFEGWVRDHNEGKKVSSLEYQVYEKLAQKEGERIIQEAKDKFNLHDALAVHRYGHLKLGDVAVWIGATATHRDDAYKASRFIIDEIKRRLPVWKKEHYLEHEPKWVFCRDHHNHIHFSESEYFQKQKGLIDQDKLKRSKVLVIGAGGLGCPALLSLASAGVGAIGVMDHDLVSISNIHRQYLYTPNDVGEKKVAIASKKLKELDPFISVEVFEERFDIDSVKVLDSYDLVLDCTDNLATKYFIHDACFKTKTPLVSASVFKFEGQLRTFNPKSSGGCLRCMSPHTPEDSHIGNCNDYGTLSSVVGTFGSLQASEALLYLVSGSNNTIDQTLFFDLRNLSNRKLKNLKKSGCHYCIGDFELEDDSLEVSMNEVKKLAARLLDIRELSDEEVYSSASNATPVVLYCHRGVRSKKMAKTLRGKGQVEVFSLKGGACSL